jgi:hypothetical protein
MTAQDDTPGMAGLEKVSTTVLLITLFSRDKGIGDLVGSQARQQILVWGYLFHILWWDVFSQPMAGDDLFFQRCVPRDMLGADIKFGNHVAVEEQ